MIALPSFRRDQWFLFASAFQMQVGFGLIFPILPLYMNEMGATPAQLGLLIAVWSITDMLMAPIWGRLSDRIGRRPVLVIGLTAQLFASLVLAFAPTIWVAIAGRLLAGALNAAFLPTAQAHLVETSAVADRSRVLGGFGAAWGFGFVCGPGLASLVMPLGIQAVFLSSAALALVNSLSSGLLLRDLPVPRDSGVAPTTPVLSQWATIRAALGGSTRLYHVLMFGCAYCGTTAISMVGIFVLQHLGADPAILPLVYILPGIVGALVQALFLARLHRWVGEIWTVRIGLMLGLTGATGFILADQVWQVILAATCVIVSQSILRPMISTLVSQYTRLSQGASMGALGAFDALARTIAPPLSGLLMAWSVPSPFLVALILYVFMLVYASSGISRDRPIPDDGHGEAGVEPPPE